MILCAFAAPQRKGVPTGNPRPLLMQRLADRVASPSKKRLGLALSQLEGLESVGHVPTSSRALSHRLRSPDDQPPQFVRDRHGSASCQLAGGILNYQGWTRQFF